MVCTLRNHAAPQLKQRCANVWARRGFLSKQNGSCNLPLPLRQNTPHACRICDVGRPVLLAEHREMQKVVGTESDNMPRAIDRCHSAFEALSLLTFVPEESVCPNDLSKNHAAASNCTRVRRQFFQAVSVIVAKAAPKSMLVRQWVQHVEITRLPGSSFKRCWEIRAGLTWINTSAGLPALCLTRQ